MIRVLFKKLMDSAVRTSKVTMTNTSVDQPEVVIYGGEGDLDTLLHVVVAAGVRPVALCPGPMAVLNAVVDGAYPLDAERLADYARQLGTRAGEPAGPIEIWDAATLKTRLENSDIPILIGSYSLRERDFFREALLYLRHELGLNNKLIHPAALGDLVSPSHRRYLISGFPGSGNMTVQNVMSRIFSMIPPAPVPPAVGQLGGYSYMHLQSVMTRLSGFFDDQGRRNEVLASTHLGFGANLFQMIGSDGECAVAGLPMRAYAWANPWTSNHEPLSGPTVDFYESQGMKCIHIVRNPLDVVVSNAGKMSIGAGQRVPQVLLSNPRWLEDMTEAVATYARGIRDQGSRCHLVRYEDLLRDPDATIRAAGAFLGKKLSKAECAEIWGQVDGQYLSGTADHKWAPGEGKWRDYIPPALADIVCRPDRVSLWRDIGYNISADDLTGQKSDVPADTSGIDFELLVWLDTRWELLCGKPPSLSSDKLSVIRRNGLLGICPDWLEETMSHGIDSPILQDMISAAYFSTLHARSNGVLSKYAASLSTETDCAADAGGF